MDSLYQAEIIDRSQHPRYAGPVPGATHSSGGLNASCGDVIRWEIRISDGVVEEIRHQCQACAICTASADLLAEALTGVPTAALKNVTSENVLSALGIPISPVRMKCAMLPLSALLNAV